MSFKYEFMSLTQIGEVFGTTSHQVGRWLANIGLRYQSKQGWKASREAHARGYVKDVGTGGQNYIWAWHSERTVKALEDAGHKICIQPSSDLLLPCKVNGPFECRPNPPFGHEIVNGDGTVAITVTGEENARVLCRLLNMAHKHGVISRALAGNPCGDGEALDADRTQAS